jgi:periplasmic copper chaperone A
VLKWPGVMRRPLLVAGGALGIVLLSALPASAHAELEPSSAAPGSSGTFELHLENEQTDAGTTSVDLRFPEGQPLVVAELPAVGGWTAAVEGGNVGGEATGVTWTRPSASPDDNPVLPIRLGPLPSDAGRLQFKVLQTYSNGEVDRWIEDWPAGAAEPEMPGPVIDLQGAPVSPGTVAPTTQSATSSTTTAASRTTPTTVATNDDESSSAVPIVIGIIAAVVVIGGVAAAIVARRRRQMP